MKKVIKDFDLWFGISAFFVVLFYLYYRILFLHDYNALSIALGLMVGVTLMTVIHNWTTRKAESIIRDQQDLIVDMMASLKAIDIMVNKAHHDVKQQKQRKSNRASVRTSAQASAAKSKA